ncbi:MAG: hypothetical protein L6R37_002100 [Teloschistes peruensis]|nr:MAG: hypothetical protein L6R37_002100 [Teloschistes peruensis]
MRRTDPRIRQTLNQISQTVESAQYSTRDSLFTFSQAYVNPCLSHLSTCLEASCAPCYACITNASSSNTPADAAARRRRGRRRGREELSFDFYDDWEAQEEEGWGNDELDRLLAGNNVNDAPQQPGRRRGMSYGGIAARRKDAEEEQMVPTSSMFGFLERLPWKIGGRGRRYKPSAADLQDVGDTRTAALKARASGEDEPLITDESESGGEGAKKRQHGRKRSGTVASQETTNSLSSRGDLFPSEDEDDAVPLDDEFAMVLARKNTQGTLDSGGGESERKTRPGSTKTRSSRSSNMRTERRRGSGNGDGKEGEGVVVQVPSVADLEEEEERVREEEEAGIEREREAARKLAAERGLLNVDEADASEQKPPADQAKAEPSVEVHPVPSHDERSPEEETENPHDVVPRESPSDTAA